MTYRKAFFPLGVLVSLLFVAPGATAGDPQTALAEAARDLRAVERPLSLLKSRAIGNYGEGDHAAASRALSGLPARLELIQGRPPEESQAALRAARDAGAAESELWQALSAARRSGGAGLPEAVASGLAARLESSTTRLSRFLAPPPAAGPAPQAPREAALENRSVRGRVDQARSSVDTMASGVRDPAALPRVFENNSSRGDVDGPVAQAQPSALRGAQTPALKRAAPDAGAPAPAQAPAPTGLITRAPPPVQAAAPAPAPVLASVGPSALTVAFSNAAGAVGRTTLPIAAARPPAAPREPAPAAAPAAAAPAAAPSPEEASALTCAMTLREHETIAQMCRSHPRLAPLLAGLVDAFKEQFGTVQGLLTNLAFLLMGLLLSVVSGFGLIAKVVVSLISLGLLATTFYALIREGWSAFRQYQGAKEGSAEYFDSFRKVGKIGGTVVILALMAVIGWGVGKSKPGKAAIDGMHGALKGKLTQLGVAGRVGSMDAAIPAPIKGLLTRIFGAPAAAPAAETARPAPAAPEPAPLQASAGPRIEPARMARAEAAVGRALSEAQRGAVQTAHEVGAGQAGRNGGASEIGNYTQSQIGQKARQLKQAGFSSSDIRSLMERGIVGNEPAVPRPAVAGAQKPAAVPADPRLQVLAKHEAMFHESVRGAGLDPAALSSVERGALLNNYLKSKGLEGTALGSALRGGGLPGAPVTPQARPAPAAAAAERPAAPAAERPAAPALNPATPRGKAVQQFADRYQIPLEVVDAALTRRAAEAGLSPKLLESLPPSQQKMQLENLLYTEEFARSPAIAPSLQPQLRGFNASAQQAAKNQFTSHGSYYKVREWASDGAKLARSGQRLFRHIQREELSRIVADNGLIPKAFKGQGESIGSALSKAGSPEEMLRLRVVDNPQAKSFLYEYTQHESVSGLGASVSTAGNIKIEIVPRAGQTFWSTNSLGNSTIGKNELGWATLDAIGSAQVKLFGAGCEAGCFLNTEKGMALARALLGSR